MIRSLFAALRLLPALVLIAGLVFVAYAGYKGSQPMQLASASGEGGGPLTRSKYH